MAGRIDKLTGPYDPSQTQTVINQVIEQMNAGYDAELDATLSDGLIYVGNVANVPVGVAMSGGATIDNAGVVTLSGAGIANVVEDTTPELGGNLDALTLNIDNVFALNFEHYGELTGRNVANDAELKWGSWNQNDDDLFLLGYQAGWAGQDCNRLHFVHSANGGNLITMTNVGDTGDTSIFSFVTARDCFVIDLSKEYDGFAVDSTGFVQLATGTTGERPGSPVNGMIRYNSTTDKFEGYENGGWANLI